jgi:uncharacterized repeat protein (TIGR01451 family)
MCELGDLAPGESATVTIQVRPTEVGPVQYTACATADNVVPTPPEICDTTTTDVVPAADLVITKEDNPEPVDVGDNLAYTLRVTNWGPETAFNVELEDDLPGNVIFIGIDEENNICNLDPGQVVECDLRTLVSGESTRVRVFVEPEEAGNIRNTARVSSTTADPRRSNNVDSITTTVEGDAEPTEPPEETTAEETTGNETTDEVTTDEETIVIDGQTIIIPDELSATKLPDTGGPGGIALAAGCALLGVGLILNRIAR